MLAADVVLIDSPPLWYSDALALAPQVDGVLLVVSSGTTGRENTINAALRGMGYSAEVHTAHGFRATARTIMDEVLGERVDFIEHQLSHVVRDTNGRAYNRTAHLSARREMMRHRQSERPA